MSHIHIASASAYTRITNQPDITDEVFNRFDDLAGELELSDQPASDQIACWLAMGDIDHAEAQALREATA